MNRQGMMTALVVAGGALSLFACDVAPPDSPATGAPAQGKTFTTEHDAWTWVSQRGRELGLQDIGTSKNDGGGLVGTSGTWIGTPAEVARAERQLLDELGGGEGVVTIAGKRYPVRAPAGESVETVTSALVTCQSDLCTDDSSFKSSWGVYQTAGSRTRVTSGGYTPHHFEIQGTQNWECVDPPGPLPYSCRQIGCNYPSSCPAGYTEQAGPNCTRICSGSRWTATTSIHVTLFETLPQTGWIVPGPNKTGSGSGPELEVKFSQWGISGGEVSRAIGVCGEHLTRSETSATGAITRWGTTFGCP